MKKLEFGPALKSFMGYLEGTQKSEHTIKNYRLDVLAFQKFVEEELNRKPAQLSQVTPKDLELYGTFLKTSGLKTNTRRRKLLTLQKFVHYLAGRKKISIELDRKIPAPHKIERVPLTVSFEDLIQAIQKLPIATLLELRNKALLWTMAETGCLVSEVTRLRVDDFSKNEVFLGGKSSRSVSISAELRSLIGELESRAGRKSSWVFQGFNKHGSLGGPITPRGVEILVKSYATRLGFKELTPRTFRHSRVLKWFGEGITREEIQKRLGLRTQYAFKTFEPLLKTMTLKSSSAATSTV